MGRKSAFGFIWHLSRHLNSLHQLGMETIFSRIKDKYSLKRIINLNCFCYLIISKEKQSTSLFYVKCLNQNQKFIFGRHKRRKKLVSEIKIDAKEKDENDDVLYSDNIDEEPSDYEESEEENVKIEKLDTNFLQLISNELSNDQPDSSDADGEREDKDESEKEEKCVTIDKDDTLKVPYNKSTLEKTKKKIQTGSVVGGLV